MKIKSILLLRLTCLATITNACIAGTYTLKIKTLSSQRSYRDCT